MCPLVQVVLTWHLPLPGLWTVNRGRTGVGTQAELGGGGGHDCPCSSQRKGSPGLSPLHPHTPTTSLLTAPLGGVQARRGWGAVHCFPSAPPPFNSLSLDFLELLVSPNIPGRDQRGRFSALAQRARSAARLPSSGPGRVALLGTKPLKDQEHKARRQEVAEGSPPWAEGSDLTKPRGPGNTSLGPQASHCTKGSTRNCPDAAPLGREWALAPEDEATSPGGQEAKQGKGGKSDHWRGAFTVQ